MLGFCHFKPNNSVLCLTMVSWSFCIVVHYSLINFWFVESLTPHNTHTTTSYSLRSDEVRKDGSPSPVSGFRMYIGVQGLSTLVLPKYLRVFSSNNSFRVYIYPRILASSSALGGWTVVDWWWRGPTRSLGLARGASCWWRVMAVCCRSRRP